MAENIGAFRQGLRALGYVEGENIIIEYRYAEGQPDRLPALAAELVRLKLDVLVPSGIRAIRAANQVTGTVPIVVPFTSDLVATGLVAGLARPGGNITGLTAMSPELTGKRLEMLKEVLPKESRIAVLWNSVQGKDLKWGEAQGAAQALTVKLQSVQVRGADDFERAFGAMTKGGAQALLTFNDVLTSTNRRWIVELASKNRLPAMYELKAFVDEGGLMSYGPHVPDMWRRAAAHVDKILKGTKPADLPVEQPMRFELVINMKTAKALGITFPPSIMVRADQVIQ
jgi:putative ABC transport system substrate-binding protein